MLTDAAAIGLSLVAIRLAARPAEGVMTYGLKRVEILSAQANGVTLLVLALLILFEAIRRLIDPPDVEGGVVLIVALVGVVVNLVATWMLAQANRESLNIEGSFQHLLTDLYAFIATAIAGASCSDRLAARRRDRLAVRRRADAARGLRPPARLRPDLPRGVADRASTPRRSAARSSREPCVAEVHDLHVWEISSGFPR